MSKSRYLVLLRLYTSLIGATNIIQQDLLIMSNQQLSAGYKCKCFNRLKGNSSYTENCSKLASLSSKDDKIKHDSIKQSIAASAVKYSYPIFYHIINL